MAVSTLACMLFGRPGVRRGSRTRSSNSGHFIAGLRTGITFLGTPRHLRIIRHFAAGLSARPADGCARPAYIAVESRVAQHEVGAGCTYLSAIEKQGDVIDSCVLAAFRQTVIRGIEAGLVTGGASIDALLHLGGLVWHCNSL